MKIRNFNTDDHVLLIAEIGQNHEGDVSLAEEMIGMAAEAGADAVKFQTFRTEYFISPKDSERYQRMSRFELDEAAHHRLAAQAKQAGLLFLSTPLDLESARFLSDVVDGFKIASADNTFYPLLETVAETAKPIIISTGLADLGELQAAVETIRSIWKKNKIEQDVSLLHCVTAYPVPAQNANLRAIETLRQAFDCTIGYSDHVLGIDAAVLAVALGARIIEKHFTINKNQSDFRDHQLSVDPEELQLLVSRIRETEAMLGDGGFDLNPSEAPLNQAVRRSIAAARDLPAGKTIEEEDIMWIRPGGGYSPGEEARVIGLRTREVIQKGQLFEVELLECAPCAE